MNQNITSIIPCFNEENTIKQVVEGVFKYSDTVIVINDNSSDKSAMILKELNDFFKDKLIVLTNNKNMGIGSSMKRGLLKAQEIESKIIIKIDGDAQHIPEDIPNFLAILNKENIDFVKGNRFLSNQYLTSMPFIKLVGNLIVTNLQKIISGNYAISDPNNGFLAFKSHIFEMIDINKLKNDYFFENSLLINVCAHNYRIREVGIKTIYSEEKSSIPTFRAALKTLPTFFKLLFLKNSIRARYNLSINSLVFFLFWPILLVNLFLNSQNLWITLALMVFIYILIDLLNFTQTENNAD